MRICESGGEGVLECWSVGVGRSNWTIYVGGRRIPPRPSPLPWGEGAHNAWQSYFIEIWSFFHINACWPGENSRRNTMTKNDTLVDVHGVEKVFNRGSEDIHVLKDLHLKVPNGEFLALMGPSGSGKSTLLNLIGGLDRPTSGTVTIAGERTDQLSDRRLAAWRARHVGFVFQLYNLLPVLTAERNVELPLSLTQLVKAER